MMSPTEIEAWGKGFKLGIEAERERTAELLVEARALERQLGALKAEVHQLEVLAAAAPDQALHWSMH